MGTDGDNEPELESGARASNNAIECHHENVAGGMPDTYPRLASGYRCENPKVAYLLPEASLYRAR